MGKILSFTILCIINFSVCRAAVERDRTMTVPVFEFPGLINGDDCCFPIKNFDLWVKASEQVGLFNSIGKTFFSRDFIEMNSRTFMLAKYDEVSDDFHNNDSPHIRLGFDIPDTKILLNLRFAEVHFINFGLLKGMVRSAGEEVDKVKKIAGKVVESKRSIIEATSRMGWCHTELVKGFDLFYDELDHLFKFYHNKYLMKPELHGIPYYIPFWLGGLGLNPGPDPTRKISPEQRKICSYIFQRYDKLKIQSVCLAKTCLINSTIERCLENEMKLHKIEDIPAFTKLEGQDLEQYDLEESNRKVYNDLLEKVWRNLDIDQFFNEINKDFLRQSEKTGAKKLFHNADVWKRGYDKISKKPEKYRELEWYKIWHQKQIGFKPIVATDHSQENEVMVKTILRQHNIFTF
jgi:hypothetical protein